MAFKPSETFFASVVFPLPGMPETLIRRRFPGGRVESFSVLYYKLVRYWYDMMVELIEMTFAVLTVGMLDELFDCLLHCGVVWFGLVWLDLYGRVLIDWRPRGRNGVRFFCCHARVRHLRSTFAVLC